MGTLVDPLVSKAKFERELAEFRQFEDTYRSRGWWLLRAQFPDVTIAFVSSKLSPPAVIFGVDINFENYDYWAPSVKLVNPFTRVPYDYNQLPSKLPRLVPAANVPPGQPMPFARQDLVQPTGDDRPPFLCMPGVREYHEHPAHTGNSWLLRRGGAEGGLNFLITQISKYGLEPVCATQMNMSFSFGGFTLRDIPP